MAETIGVRELRRDLSEYLRRVERGESFAVTSRGRPVAVLGPSPERRDPLDRLVIERHGIPARIDLLDVEPLELPGGPPLSDLLNDVRDDRLQLPGLTYLDASAIVKLVVDERESPALRDVLRDRPRRVSSALALVEVHLAAGRRVPAPPPGRVDTVLAGLALIPVDHPTLERAAGLGAYGVRALDAIHLASAQSLGDDLDSLIAYDQRLLTAAEASGLRIEQPR